MPNPEKLKLILTKDSTDIKDIRLPGLNKNLDQMTIGELVQLRNNGGPAEDCYDVNGIGSDLTVSSSCLLNELGRVRAEQIMKSAVIEQEITHRTLGISKTPGVVIQRADNMEYANAIPQEPPKQESLKKRILEQQ